MQPTFVKTIIYDLDGTLIDSAQDIQNSLNEVLRRQGKRVLNREMTERYIGGGMPQLLKQAFDTISQEELDHSRNSFVQVYSEQCLDNTTLFPDVENVLKFFEHKHQVVLTNKPERFSKQVLEGLNANHFFQMMICGDSTSFLKPDKRLVEIIQQRFPSANDTVVIVGDSPIDIQTGKQAGIKTCAVTYGYRRLEELEAEQPDWIISHLSELKHLLC